ncbi:MAG: HAD family hydrolase [Prolixibacteraceae bacterium]
MDKLEPMQPETSDLCPNLKKEKPVKAVIFDIYGTLLISSSGDIDQAVFTEENMKEALIEGGFADENTKTETYSFLLKELPVKIASNQKETAANGHPYPDVDIFKVWNEMLAEAEKKGWIKKTGDESLADTIIVFEILSNKVSPMPGMKKVLEALKAKNVPLGIVSNAQFYTPIIMNYFLTGEFSTRQEIEFFEPELTAFSFSELRAKPDVELFEKITPALVQKYGIKPSEAVFVGNDILKDVYTAKKAGMQTMLFAGDNRSLRLRETDERMRGLFPDFIITDLKQILTIIE